MGEGTKIKNKIGTLEKKKGKLRKNDAILWFKSIEYLESQWYKINDLISKNPLAVQIKTTTTKKKTIHYLKSTIASYI